ncbi:hypothetical protein BABINDRAFT_39270, partial [Babjeviella inositovora NRRL Y-12698]
DSPSDLTQDSPANGLLKYNFLSHMALDSFLLPFYDSQKGSSLFFIQDSIAVYGYETNTGLKIVVGTSTRDSVGEALRPVFQQIHKVYIRLMCNPFQSITDEQTLSDNKRMQSSIMGIVDTWNNAQ